MSAAKTSALRTGGQSANEVAFPQQDAPLTHNARGATQRTEADGRKDESVSRLAAAFGLALDLEVCPNVAESIRVLCAAGVTAEAAEVVEWLPALDVAWQGGIDVVERDRLFAVAGLGASPVAAMDVIADWCVTKPATEVFDAGLIVLRCRLARLPKDERDLLFARVLGACDTVANAAGGWTGFRRVSAAERRVLHKSRSVLRRKSELVCGAFRKTTSVGSDMQVSASVKRENAFGKEPVTTRIYGGSS